MSQKTPPLDCLEPCTEKEFIELTAKWSTSYTRINPITACQEKKFWDNDNKFLALAILTPLGKETLYKPT